MGTTGEDLSKPDNGGFRKWIGINVDGFVIGVVVSILMADCLSTVGESGQVPDTEGTSTWDSPTAGEDGRLVGSSERAVGPPKKGFDD